MPSPDPMEMLDVHIVCNVFNVKARYDQTVKMTRKHFEEISQNIEDDEDVEDEIFAYLNLEDPIDLDFGCGIDDFEIVTEPETQA